MSNDRFKFRCACFVGKEFIGFAYMDGLDSYWDYTQTGTDSDTNGKTAYTSDPEQCTGLKDKNGNLIYENDRVKALDQKGTVRFGFYRKTDEHFPDAIYGFYIDWDTKPCFRQDFGYWVTDGIKIIGNVHTEEPK